MCAGRRDSRSNCVRKVSFSAWGFWCWVWVWVLVLGCCEVRMGFGGGGVFGDGVGGNQVEVRAKIAV